MHGLPHVRITAPDGLDRSATPCSFAASAAKSKFHDSRVFNSHSSEFARHRLGAETVGPQSPHAPFGGDWVRCIGHAIFEAVESLRCRTCDADAQDKSEKAVIKVTGKMQSPRYSFPKSSRFTAGAKQKVSKTHLCTQGARHR